MDLMKIFSRKKAESPEVLGVLLHKDIESQILLEVLTDSGIECTKKQEVSEDLVFWSNGEDLPESLDNVTLVKSSDDVVVVMKRFAPWEMVEDGAAITDIFSANGAWPNVYSALDTCYSLIQSALFKADSPVNAVTEIQKIFAATSDYVSSYLSTVPVAAFKFEKEVSGMKTEDQTKVVKNEDTEGFDGVTSAVTSISENIAKMAEAVASLASRVDVIEKSVETSQSMTDDKMKSVLAVLEKTAEASTKAAADVDRVMGAVLVKGADVDDTTAREVKKRDGLGPIDTAYSRPN